MHVNTCCVKITHLCNDAGVIDALLSDSNAFISLDLIFCSIWCLVSYYWLSVPQPLDFHTRPAAAGGPAGGPAGPGASPSAGRAGSRSEPPAEPGPSSHISTL